LLFVAFTYCTELLEIDPAHAQMRVNHKREQGRLIEAHERLSMLCIREDTKEDIVMQE
jgi:hypothetical protein